MKERIRLLDILRGIAVLGTLGTNIWIFAHLGDLHYITTFGFDSWWSVNDFLRMLVLFLVNGKLLGLLTIMFGVGLELKYRQALRRGHPWPGVYIWTSVFLLLEGFLHFFLVLEYDILMSYGITAIIVAYIVKGGDKRIRRTMRIFGSFCALLFLFIFSLPFIGAHMSLGSFAEIVTLYKEGSWLEQVQYRLNNFFILRSEAFFVIPTNIFLFLLGVRLMRAGAFSPDEKGRAIRHRLFHIGLWLGVPLNLLIFVPGGAFDLPVRYFFAPLMSLFYIGLISKIYEKYEHISIWKSFECVGKISLSTYVMQNIIASFLFYGWGFGLGGNLSSLAIIAIWFLIIIAQILFAVLWMKRFTLGPMKMVRKRVTSLHLKA